MEIIIFHFVYLLLGLYQIRNTLKLVESCFGGIEHLKRIIFNAFDKFVVFVIDLLVFLLEALSQLGRFFAAVELLF